MVTNGRRRVMQTHFLVEIAVLFFSPLDFTSQLGSTSLGRLKVFNRFQIGHFFYGRPWADPLVSTGFQLMVN